MDTVITYKREIALKHWIFIMDDNYEVKKVTVYAKQHRTILKFTLLLEIVCSKIILHVVKILIY